MPLDDTALLERWKTRRDAEAFDEIVRRFADQVFGTCRRILRNDADAEEVAQECFLLLVRSGGEVRTSLGGWLHRAATTRSLDRIRHEARRRARESAYERHAPKATEASWDDIQEHVDAAINQLPESTRDMIVAHFLGRKTHEEIAEELGMNRRAVSQRIQRGLDTIRRDFARRGIALSAAALGPLLADNFSSAAPLSLKASLGKLAIAAGTAGSGAGGTAATTSLIGSLLIMKMKLVALALIVGMVAGGVYWGMPRANDSPKSDPIPEIMLADRMEPSIPTSSGEVAKAETVPTASESDGAMPSLEDLLALSQAKLEEVLEQYPEIADPAQFASVSGTVVDTNGYPIDGAYVYVMPERGWGSFPDTEGRLRSAISGADGRYAIEGIDRSGFYAVGASKYGYADQRVKPALEIAPGARKSEIDFVLDSGVQLEGVILSSSGKPVPSAVVQCIGTAARDMVSLGQENTTVTDTKGEFTLGFPKDHTDYVAALRVHAGKNGQATFAGVPIDSGRRETLRMMPPAIIQGTLTSDRGEPVPHGRISFGGQRKISAAPDDPPGTWGMPLSSGFFTAQCDSEGRYAVAVDAGIEFRAQVGDENIRMTMKRPLVAALASGEIRAYDVTVATMTIQIKGKILGQQSGIPVDVLGGFRVSVVTDTAIHMDAQTHSAFSLSFPLAEGRYQLQARYEFNDFAAGPRSEPVDLSSDGKNYIELVVPDPQVFTLRAVDGNGNPVEGARVNVMTSTIENYQTNELTNADGRIDGPITMPPDCGARLWLEKPGYAPAWGAIHENQSPGTIQAEDLIVLTASAGFEGELADAEGNPVANAELSITLTSPRGQSWPLETTTDGEGHFTVVDQAPAEVVDIEIVIKPQPGPVEFRVGNDVVTLPSPIGSEPFEPDLRVWSAEQIALEAKTITDLGNMSLVEEGPQDE
ncbi:MAG: sigma-70 family RNA polymerase sigma factor [Candidatus Hydrogenedentes bacterium]|nr:sigma-70 family RNA polymerase sigma factor [Candidatus Hydrogenedentota bacterium]